MAVGRLCNDARLGQERPRQFGQSDFHSRRLDFAGIRAPSRRLPYGRRGKATTAALARRWKPPAERFSLALKKAMISEGPPWVKCWGLESRIRRSSAGRSMT